MFSFLKENEQILSVRKIKAALKAGELPIKKTCITKIGQRFFTALADITAAKM